MAWMPDPRLARALLLAGCAAVVAAAAAASPAAAPAPQPPAKDPTDASVPVPPLHHRSPLAAYRAASDVRPVAWPTANAQVAPEGALRTQARDTPVPAGAASAASPPPAHPMTGHSHHHHGGRP